MAVKMIEDAERAGAAEAGRHDHRGHVGQHRHGPRDRRRRQGLRCIFTTTDKQSKEKVDALKAFGAEVIVCPTNVDPEDPRSYYSVSSRLEREVPERVEGEPVRQPVELARRTTSRPAPEIWEQTDGRITHLVVGVGTGGTISGVGRYLKETQPEDQGLGHRHLRVGVQEVQGDRHLRQERDLPVHHRGHRRGLPAEERRLRRHRSLREGDRQGRGDHDAAHRARRRDLRRQLGRLGDGGPAAARATTSPRATSSS